MTTRLDNMGIVVDDLAPAIAFFRDLGLELEGEGVIEGEWAGHVTGLGEQCVEVAMMRTPDGRGRLELSRFVKPAVIGDHRMAPVNALGYLRVMFAVDDLDGTLDRLAHRRHLFDSLDDAIEHARLHAARTSRLTPVTTASEGDRR